MVIVQIYKTHSKQKNKKCAFCIFLFEGNCVSLRLHSLCDASAPVPSLPTGQAGPGQEGPTRARAGRRQAERQRRPLGGAHSNTNEFPKGLQKIPAGHTNWKPFWKRRKFSRSRPGHGLQAFRSSSPLAFQSPRRSLYSGQVPSRIPSMSPVTGSISTPCSGCSQ